jgi:hypothetical protein
MSSDDLGQAQVIVEMAEAELAAFLRSTHAVLGFGDPLTSGSLWIDTMTSHGWPATNHKSFFRAVTILSIVRLVSIHVTDRERVQPTGKLPNARNGAYVASGIPSTAV